jgi:hypothetical protein
VLSRRIGIESAFAMITRCFRCCVSESPVDPLAVRQHGADDYSPVMESKDDYAVVTSLELIRLLPRVSGVETNWNGERTTIAGVYRIKRL